MKKLNLKRLLALFLVFGFALTTNAQIFEDDFSTDKGWIMSGTWERGAAVVEPATDHGGDGFILANPLGSDYPSNMARQDVTSPVIDCGAYTSVILEYQSFSGCEESSWDHMGVEVFDGIDWVEIWSNPGDTFQETEWTLYSFDVTAQAAGNSDFQVRFYMGTSDGSVQRSGFAIDNFVVREPSSETDFTAFSFPGDETGAANIDAGAHTIDIEVAASSDLATLISTFQLSAGATVAITGTPQVSGTTTNDFSSSVTYDVTAEDGSTVQAWTVNVTQAVISSETDITAFSFAEQTGAATISALNHTVDIEIGWQDDLANLTASFFLSAGASTSVAATPQVSGTTSNDFSSGPLTYNVLAEDGTTNQDWTVTVTQEIAPLGAVCSNPILLSLPVANETGNTSGMGDEYTSPCGGSYMDGDDVVYQFTTTENLLLSGEMTSSVSWIGMFILDGCPDAGANCVVTATSTGNSVSFTEEFLPAGTYFVVISNWPTPQSIDFDFSLTTSPASSETDFLTFTHASETGAATIDTDAHTILMEVGAGTDLATLVAGFTLSAGATAEISAVSQVSGTTANDFSSSLTYDVTAQDGTTTQAWTVTVTEATINSETDITTFSFPEQTGAATINTTNHTVDIEINWEADLATLTASFDLSFGASATIAATPQVSGTTSNDFSSGPLTYNILAEDGTTNQDWTVTVTQGAVPQGALCSNPIPLSLPVTNEIGNTAGFGDDYDETMACGSNYMKGDDIVYEFTTTENLLISGELTTTASYPGLFILDGCPDSGANCVLSATNGGTSVSFTDEFLPAGTYFVIISSWAAPQSIDFDFSLTTSPANSETDFLTFTHANETGVATIDDDAHTIALEVGAGTNIATLIAGFSLSSGASAEVASTPQVSGTTANDFTSPITYDITAQDGTTVQAWTVTVTEATVNTETDITAFSFAEQTGDATINATDHTVNIEVNSCADLASLTPTVSFSYGATTTQTTTDFSGPVTYDVLAEDAVSTENWTVNVTQASAPDEIDCGNAFAYNINDAAYTNTLCADGVLYVAFTLDQTYADVVITTTGSSFDTKLAYFSDCSDIVDDMTTQPTSPMNSLGYDDDGGEGNTSQITETTLGAGTYIAAIYGFGATSNGDVQFTVTGRLPSSDATLSDLTQGGTTVTGFASGTLDYSVELPFGTSAYPAVVGTPTDANASVANVVPGTFPGTVTITVTAEDNSTQDYTIEFTVASALSSDATLSDLTQGGTTVTAFASGTFDYSVELPFGTSAYPAVVGTPTHINASAANVVPGTFPGTVTITVTAEDNSTQDYTIEFTVASALSSDATLSDLTQGGTTVTGFASGTFDYGVELPFGTSAYPAVVGTPTDANASAANVVPGTFPGTVTITVTAEDGSTQDYTIEFTVATALSSDATLSDLTLNSFTVIGFAPGTFDYSVELPFGTSAYPAVVGTPTDANASAANVVPGTFPGTVTITVTAEDNSTQDYTIEFTVADPLSSDATLSDLTQGGTTVTGFASGTFAYTVVLPFGSDAYPTVIGTATDANASISYDVPAIFPGDVTVTVEAEDGTILDYVITFEVANSIGTISETEVVIFPNPSNGLFTIQTELSLDVVLTDVTGKVINEFNTADQRTVKINSSGVYFIKFSDKNSTIAKKLIVN